MPHRSTDDPELEDVEVSVKNFDLKAAAEGEFRARATAVPTGIIALDHRLQGGVRRHSLNFLCGYTGYGKSSLSIHLAQTAASYGCPVIIFYHQMTLDDYSSRLIAWETGIPYSDYSARRPRGFSADISLDDLRVEGAQSIQKIPGHIRSLQDRSEGNPVILIDSIDGLFYDRYGFDAACAELATAAEDSGAVIWATSQANDRGMETDTVTVECLRESQGKAHPASLVLGLGKTGEKTGGKANDEIVTLTADKNRHGRKFQIRVRADYQSQRFFDLDDAYETPQHLGS